MGADSVEARAALRSVLGSTSGDLLAYFERRLRSREDAADLVGETLLQAWRRIDQLPLGHPERQRMWLFTIAAFVMANHRRTLRRRGALAERLRQELAALPPPPEEAEAAGVRDAVLRLRDAHRELIILVHWDGFTVVEAAEILGLNASTARSRYGAARETLKKALAEHSFLPT